MYAIMYLLPFSPLDPSAEDKAQETFARLYEEHLTSSNTEDQTKTSTNDKTILIQQELRQSKSEEQKYESSGSNKTWSKSNFDHLPSNGVNSNGEEKLRTTMNPSNQLHKEPLSSCSKEESKAVSTNNSIITNTHQNVFGEHRVSNSEDQSSTMTTNTSTNAFVKNILHQQQENNTTSKTSTNNTSLHQRNTTTTKTNTDPFMKNSLQQQEENTTTTKTNMDAFMKNSLHQQHGNNNTSTTSTDAFIKSSVHKLQEKNMSSKSSSSVSSMCQETSTKSRHGKGKDLTD